MGSEPPYGDDVDCGVCLPVAAAVEPVPIRHPRRDGDGRDAAEHGAGRFRPEPFGVVSDRDQSVESGRVATRCFISCMRVMPHSWSCSSSGAEIMSALINCSATLHAATAVNLAFCSILRASTMPSRLFGVTVLAPVNCF